MPRYIEESEVKRMIIRRGWMSEEELENSSVVADLPSTQCKGKWDCPMPGDGQTVWIYCPDCVYHDFVFEGATFMGNRCRWNERRGRMSDLMQFPNTVEEFMEQYKIVDTEEVYTNRADLVPIFRMKQWFDHLPSAQPEPLTDKERRIFLAAMGREEEVCKEVDAEMTREPYEDSLVKICREIIRKVKGTLWT